MKNKIEIHEPMIWADDVLKRWTGCLDHELAELIDESGKLFSSPTIPTSYIVDKVLRDKSGNVISECRRVEPDFEKGEEYSAPYGVHLNGNEPLFDFEGLAFKLKEIEQYEHENPRLLFELVTNQADVWSCQPPESDCFIPAQEDARVAELEAQLAMAQATIAKLQKESGKILDFNDAGPQPTEAEMEVIELEERLARLQEDMEGKDARIAELEKELAAAKAEPATTVNATKWGNSVAAAFEVWVEIIQGDKTDWKEDGFRAALAERCNDYHTKVHDLAWRILPTAFKHGIGRPPKNPEKSQQSDNS